MQYVDGKKIAERMKEEIRELMKSSGPKSLGIFYIGENKVIDSYVTLKKKMGESLGISVEVFKFDDKVSEKEIIEKIKEVKEKYSGLIIQLPLPEKLNKENILNSIPTEKDVDVLSVETFRAFTSGKTEKTPPVVSAISEIVKVYKIDLKNKNIVVVGKGRLVGLPVGAWLERENLTFEFLDKDDNTLKLNKADVIISGVGIPGIIGVDQIKDGVVLIDAGASTSSGKILGDIDKNAYIKAGLVSPVPGGVGPITVVSLFKNLFLN